MKISYLLTHLFTVSLFIMLFTANLCASAQGTTGTQPTNWSQAGWSKMNSMQQLRALTFTTPAYRNEALRLIIQEANRVAQELNLPEDLPITKTNLLTSYISPPRMARGLKTLGNITTSNYTYYVSVGNKFSFLTRTHLRQEMLRLKSQYLWPISRMDTNSAYQIATQLLTSASMDVSALNRDCEVHIDAFAPEGENGKHFVPVYSVYWTEKEIRERGSVASIQFLEPTKMILQMHVNKSEYILRQPLQITNLDYLLSQTNAPAANKPHRKP